MRARRLRAAILAAALLVATGAAAAGPPAREELPRLLRDLGAWCSSPDVGDDCGAVLEPDGVLLWQARAAVRLRFDVPVEPGCVPAINAVVCPATPPAGSGAGLRAEPPYDDPAWRAAIYRLHVASLLWTPGPRSGAGARSGSSLPWWRPRRPSTSSSRCGPCCWW
jgi:hypothetical protein